MIKKLRNFGRILILLIIPIFYINSILAKEKSTNDDSVYIESDYLERINKENFLLLEGNVKIVYQKRTFLCDKANYYPDEKKIIAEGNLFILTKDSKIKADKGEVFLEQKQGDLTDSQLVSGQVLFTGEQIKKIDDETYEVKNAYYTACYTCPAGWSFTGSYLRASMGNYAHIKNAVFRIADFPVFWLPYLVVPLKTDRQSGFLPPSFQYSVSSGPALTINYFWAINKSQDATFKLQTYAKRGFQLLSEYRYKLSNKSKGNFYGGFIQDEVFNTSSPNIDSNFIRYFTKYTHLYSLPFRIKNKTNISLISDLKYPTDFPIDILGHSLPSLLSKTSFYQSTSPYFWSVNFIHNKNLLKQDPLSKNKDSIKVLPKISYNITGLEIPKTNLKFNLNSEFSNFTRNEKAFDDVDQDNLFNPNADIIRTGKRALVNSSVSTHKWIGNYFKLLPKIKFSHSTYLFSSTVSPTLNRSLFETSLALQSSINKVYKINNFNFKHLMNFEVSGHLTPFITQDDSLFFGKKLRANTLFIDEPLNDKDIFFGRGLQFDYYDYYEKRKNITLNINNYFIQKYNSNYKKFASLNFSQSYNFKEEKEIDPKPLSPLRTQFTLSAKRFTTNTTYQYFHYFNVSNISTWNTLKIYKRNSIFFTYKRNFSITSQFTNFSEKNRTENTGAGFNLYSKYADFSGSFDYSNLSKSLHSWRLLSSLKPPGNCWKLFLDLRKIIDGDLNILLNFEFLFSGKNGFKDFKAI